jgi:hypothetical protein
MREYSAFSLDCDRGLVGENAIFGGALPAPGLLIYNLDAKGDGLVPKGGEYCAGGCEELEIKSGFGISPYWLFSTIVLVIPIVLIGLGGG